MSVMRTLRGGGGALAAVAVAAGLLAGAAGAAAADGGRTQAAGAVKPAASCASLAGRDFSRVPDAPGAVTSSALVKINVVKAKPRVTFCEVKGVFAPHTRFEMLLPAATWHGQYVQEGCTTLCGSLPKSFDYPLTSYVCTAIQDGQLALATDDEGHTSSSDDGSWAKDSLRLRVVFGVTSENSLAHMARAVITAYYGRPAAYSYYDGCSDGGREGLMLAQRYPDDFNGIIAGSAAMNMAPQTAILDAWLVRSNTAPDGHQIVTAEDIPALHAAVIRACGNASGIIADPRRCGFSPASIQCPPRVHSYSCLTAAQVAAVRKFYLGPTDQYGRSLSNGGEPYGSELGWVKEFVEPAADSSAPASSPEATLALNYLKYMAFWPNPPAGFSLADVRFTDQEFYRVQRLGNAIYNANDPDLRAFEAHGGKLIMYHGWADQAIPPWSTIDYYAAVERTMGGFRASQAFSRLYMIPGAYHCLFAPNKDVNIADFLTPLIAWVQHGDAPGTIPADTSNGKEITMEQSVSPYDALARVKPAPGSLNGYYQYLGRY
jgi:hypothetical protein